MRMLSVLAVAGLLAGAACANDGRELRPPDPAALATTTSTTTSSTVPSVAGPGTASGLVLTSPAFAEGGSIPVEHTCEGADVSPPLEWEGVPPGTAELALVVEDPNAEFFVHWVLAGIPPTVTSIGRGSIPAGTVEATNDAGSRGWSGPCPPDRHVYVFTLHVLLEPVGLQPGIDGREAVGLVEQASTDRAVLTGTFTPNR